MLTLRAKASTERTSFSIPSSFPPLPSFSEISQQGAYIVELNMGPLNSCIALFTFLVPVLLGTKYQEGDIISVRYRNMWKGRKGGFFPNALMIDVWTMGKERKVKYFASKALKGALQLCNMQSSRDALLLAGKICDVLNAAVTRAKQIICIPTFTAPLTWLYENSIGETYMQLVRFCLRKDELLGNMRFCTEVPLREFRMPYGVPEEHRVAIEIFFSLSTDLVPNDIDSGDPDDTESTGTDPESAEDEEEIIMLSTIGKIPHKRLSGRIAVFLDPASYFSDCSFHTTGHALHAGIIQRFNLGGKINRHVLNRELLARGYDSYYVNKTGTSVMVHMYSQLAFSPEKMRRNDKSGMSKFTFSPGGAVSHHGAIPHLMEDNHARLIADLVEILPLTLLP